MSSQGWRQLVFALIGFAAAICLAGKILFADTSKSAVSFFDAGVEENDDNNKPLVSVVVPTFNEEDNIALLLAEIGQALSDYAYEVIVVDDGTDKTGEIASEFTNVEAYCGISKGLGAGNS